MGLRSAFFRDLTRTAIDGLAEYFDAMEAQIASMKTEDEKRIRSDIENLELDRDQRIAEWDIAMQQHTATYDMLFTNWFRYSFVVLLCLFVEDKLRELCEVVVDVKGYPGLSTPPRGDVVRTYMRHLNRAGMPASDSLWESIRDLYRVRNCIVHTSGNVTRSRDEHILRNIAERGLGITISDFRYRGTPDPLYLEDNMLVIEPMYCNRAVSDVRQLFEELCDAVPLYSIDFDSLFRADEDESNTSERADNQ
ncbi:MAG: hypothetical protein ISS53_00400 [Dehalococcoidia bacterium]|nr:hypothetical protein [Dehalococcoidia bacterium]